MTRVIHTGDTHVGYQQYHAPERRQDFLDAFRRVIEDAVELEVDAVVHAGDLFHDRRPDLEDLLGTIDVLRTLREAGIPLLAIVGNHEGTHSAQWLDLFETLGLATRLNDAGTVVEDTAFYGLDFVPRSQRGALAYDFEPRDVDHTALVAHGRFTPFAHADWETDTVLTSASVDFDTVLLGDIHEHGRETVNGVPVTYCGSTERASAEERDPRGYNIVTFEDDVRITRRGIETRPFVFVDVELAAEEGTDRVRQRVREEAVEDAVLIVTVTGAGGTVTAAEIESLGTELGALVTRVNDRRDREDADAAPAVQFADPDAAVEERIRELGLSEVARTVDERVRDLEVAKTNVRDAVAEAVRDRLDDPAAFESTQATPDAKASDDTAESAEDAMTVDASPTADGAAAAEDTTADAPGTGGTETAESAEDDAADQATMGEFL